MKLRGFFVYGHPICLTLKIRYPAIQHTGEHIRLSLGNAQPHSQVSPILYGTHHFPNDVFRHFPPYHIFLTGIQQYM